MDVQNPFVDVSGAPPRKQVLGPSVVVRKQQIAAEVERLIDSERPANGRRASMIVHPLAVAPGLGFAPGIDVTLNVLKPGESTTSLRRNSNLLEMCIGGSGLATVDGRALAVSKWDVWNVPSMRVHSYRNEGREPMVRLSYSNAPVLEKLDVHFVEENPEPVKADPAAVPGKQRSRDLAGRIQLGDEGAWLLGYEYLVDIDVVESKPLLWRWEEVARHLPAVRDLAPGYDGRRLFVLYNPATERRNGTTGSFFATLSSSPPGNRHVPHRHISSAINYWFRGHGHSIVEGERVEWSEGDLMLSAPGWAVHCHYMGDEVVSALTVQDHPFHIAMESLIWQERIDEPIRTLGSQTGFNSNRAELVTQAG